jgi:hypothetical protein
MRWEDRLTALFDDLEQQAEGLALAERDAEVAERSRAEYAGVDLAARLHASVERSVAVHVVGFGWLVAPLTRVGADWCLFVDGHQEWVVPFAAVSAARGLSERAVGVSARRVTARLGLGSFLRGVAESREPVLVHRRDGASHRGAVRRVGADFLELSGHDGTVDLLPFGHLAALRRT